MVRFAQSSIYAHHLVASVDVVKGVLARERLRFSIFVTTASAPPMASTTACASLSVVISIFHL